MREIHRILVSGEGGQGIQLLSKSLVKAAHLSKMKISYVPNYGVEQRGGVSLGFSQVSNQEIGFPKFQYADILVILAERAVPRIKEYIMKDTLIVYDKALVPEEKLKDIANKTIAIEAYDIASEKLIPKVFNMIVLGYVADLVGGISAENLHKVIDEMLSPKYEKRPELKHLNAKALEIGMSGIESKEEVKV
jgi:2-oxoglutarate ferredoxin oxidoreductase subunit gamma